MTLFFYGENKKKNMMHAGRIELKKKNGDEGEIRTHAGRAQ